MAAFDECRGPIEPQLPVVGRVECSGAICGCSGSIPGRRHVQARPPGKLFGRRDERLSAKIPGRQPEPPGAALRRPIAPRAPHEACAGRRPRGVPRPGETGRTQPRGRARRARERGLPGPRRTGRRRRPRDPPRPRTARRRRLRPPDPGSQPRATHGGGATRQGVRSRSSAGSRRASSSPTARAVSARSAAILIARAKSDPVGSSSIAGGRPPITAVASSWARPGSIGCQFGLDGGQPVPRGVDAVGCRRDERLGDREA